MLPSYNLSDLRKVVAELIATNGQTTTKEVKEALRKQGFWAEQTGVSLNMEMLAELGELVHDDGANWGQYRTYTLRQQTPNPVSTATPSNIKSQVVNSFNRLKKMLNG